MRLRLGLAVVAVALMCTAHVLAQEQGQRGQRGQQGQRGQGRGGFQFGGGFGGFGGGFGTSRLGLLRIEEVQKELELVDEQLTAIQKVRDELQPRGGFGERGRGRGGEGNRGRRGGNNPGGNNPPPSASLSNPADWYFVQQEAQPPQRGQRGQRGTPPTAEELAQREKERAERLKQEKDKLAEILLPHQMKRLNEIYYQQLGERVVDDPDIVAALKITPEQKEKFAAVREENQAAMRTMMQELFAGGNRGEGGRGFQFTEEQRTKLADARKKNEEKLFAVLTDAQRKQLDELKGKPFDMPEQTFGRGRGGPGGGAGGRGRGGDNPRPNP